MFDHCSKRYYWSVKEHSKPPLIWCLPLRNKICFADSSSIPWNPPTVRCPVWTVMASQMYLLLLCALLSRQSHLFPICAFVTHNDSRIIPRNSCQITKNVSVNDLWFPRRLQELQALLCFLRSFCFTWVGLYPLGGHVLHRDSVSMIMLRFTSFAKDFVIRSYKITYFPLWARLYRCVSCKKPLKSFLLFGN